MVGIVDNQNLIHLAIEKNSIETVQELLAAGVSITKSGPDGLSPLARAMEHENIEIVKLFLDSCDVSEGDLDDFGYIETILIASEVGHLNFIERWVDNGNALNLSNFSSNETPFHCATKKFHKYKTLLLWYLLLNGADANVKDKQNQTPLHSLVNTYEERDYVDAISEIRHVRTAIFFLTRAGVDINGKDSLGRSPLLSAKFGKKCTCFFDLLRFGANINIEDKMGETILDYIHEKLEDENCLKGSMSRKVMQIERELYEPTRILVHHAMKLNVIELHVSERIKSRVRDLIDWLSFMEGAGLEMSEKYTKDKLSTEDIHTFTFQCQIEAEKMKNVEIDSCISMKDILSQTDYEMMNLAKNEKIQEYFESGQCKEEYPNYWYLLDLRYNAGIVRSILQPIAEDTLQNLAPNSSNSELELVLQRVTNAEMIDFINVGFSSNPDIRRGRILSCILSENNHFNYEEILSISN